MRREQATAEHHREEHAADDGYHHVQVQVASCAQVAECQDRPDDPDNDDPEDDAPKLSLGLLLVGHMTLLAEARTVRHWT
jgi:hypothetical protein